MENEVKRISYYGNQKTNKYKNNVMLALNPFYTNKDTVTMIDLYNKKRSSNIKVNMNGRRAVLTTHYFHKHTGELCLIQQLTGNERQDISHKVNRNYHQYLLISNSDIMKPVLLITILDWRVTEEFKKN